MAKRKATYNLYDPRHDGQAICLSDLQVSGKVFDPARTNYFTIYLIESGSGTVWADASQFAFGPSSLLFFVPYQHIRIIPDSPVQGEVIQFHANFLCVETFHAEVGCSGILFNDPYGIPVVQLDEEVKIKVLSLIDDLRREQTERGLAFSEVMLAHLKVLLILATRLKSSHAVACGPAAHDPQHPVLIELRELIEANYCTLHSPSDYAKLLHITAKTLGRIVRENLGTTPTELIRARILTHTKWQLLHTLKPVKEVAKEVGYSDELYFSRLFKKATGYSPTFFREFETEIRGGSNLSMLSSHAPILDSDVVVDNDSQTKKKSKPTGA
ncbi:MAG: AraC family transcriptional regulator [Gimesia sp.]|uniref:helix-turn-helix domain-containing protein n=1 Tax=Gimesia sp. TaxID=2024833 RepID=UPI000C4671FE|nr:AraC family transcriptional regulator [Gimesia sp.]MAX38831.1 AraC family transcriptional regulator [Gimesia sp.]|tara:strand:+ start:1144 stop:2124 length:981 start_codon:yes stop_codon:yes gene_type:complete